ncbi:MAG: hypothetical protein SVY53_05180 [Chloroflexota bacterium]|nr:hypothetical protein [Chloroflexota bacterium]
MVVVDRYDIQPITKEMELCLPAGAKILAFKYERGGSYLWVLNEVGEEYERRKFILVSTNEVLPYTKNELVYICTFEANCVLHLFEVVDKLWRGEE